MIKEGFLIFSGANFRAVITLCRHLKKVNIPFFIFAIDENDPIFDTAYAKEVVYTRKTRKLLVENLKPEIEKVYQKYQLSQIIICPTSEFLNTFLLQKRAELENDFIKIPLTEKETYAIITNKNSFTNYCAEKGATIPKEYSNLEKIGLPMVAKPKENVMRGKTLYPQLIFSEKDKKQFVENEEIEDYFFQEYIKGESYYLFYYINKSNKISKFSQKNLAQQPKGKSIFHAKSAQLHQHPISDLYEKILLSLGFQGIVMIEVIEREGTFYLIEANPRFWGPFKLVTDAKPSFLHAFFADYVSNFKINYAKEKATQYLWLGGAIEALPNKNQIKWYIKKPVWFLPFLLRKIRYDVYFRIDTIRYFFKELRK